MKQLANFIIILFIFLISSCSLMRTIGIYNIPPDYADTYKEIYGKKFIKHNNDTKNLFLVLETQKKEYSPYEEIELLLKVYNIGTT